MTAQKTAKSLAPITVRVRRTTSFRVSADLKCRLLATDETSIHSRQPDTVALVRSRSRVKYELSFMRRNIANTKQWYQSVFIPPYCCQILWVEQKSTENDPLVVVEV